MLALRGCGSCDRVAEIATLQPLNRISPKPKSLSSLEFHVYAPPATSWITFIAGAEDFVYGIESCNRGDWSRVPRLILA